MLFVYGFITGLIACALMTVFVLALCHAAAAGDHHLDDHTD